MGGPSLSLENWPLAYPHSPRLEVAQGSLPHPPCTQGGWNEEKRGRPVGPASQPGKAVQLTLECGNR